MLKKMRNRGITLISLIVTIVVLLILAGVTISQITGSESAMEKATEAREKDKQGAELDAIKLAVVNSVASGLNGLVDANVLKNELNGLVYETSRNAITTAKTSWIVTSNSGLKYKIKQNGEVTLAEPVETVEFTETTISIKIGQSKALPLSIKGKSGNETEANNIEYQFSAENIAEVLDNGQIKIKDTVSPDAEVTVKAIADGVESLNLCKIIAEEDLIQIGDAINADKYGYKVNGYDVQLDTVGCWRLFYQDEENTYIISDKLIGSNAPYSNYNSFSTGADVSAEGKGLNAKYYSYNNHLGFTSNNSNNNIKAVKWFTDTSNTSSWNIYKDAEGKARFAIASPTIDLYTASYNAVSVLDDADTISAIELPIPSDKGYSYSSTRPNGLDTSTVTHQIYGKEAKNSTFWLSSPSSESSASGACLCVANSYITIGDIQHSPLNIRPIVCIPTKVFDKTYTLQNN